jgi:hypothetical protein
MLDAKDEENDDSLTIPSDAVRFFSDDEAAKLFTSGKQQLGDKIIRNPNTTTGYFVGYFERAYNAWCDPQDNTSMTENDFINVLRETTYRSCAVVPYKTESAHGLAFYNGMLDFALSQSLAELATFEFSQGVATSTSRLRAEYPPALTKLLRTLQNEAGSSLEEFRLNTNEVSAEFFVNLSPEDVVRAADSLTNKIVKIKADNPAAEVTRLSEILAGLKKLVEKGEGMKTRIRSDCETSLSSPTVTAFKELFVCFAGSTDDKSEVAQNAARDKAADAKSVYHMRLGNRVFTRIGVPDGFELVGDDTFFGKRAMLIKIKEHLYLACKLTYEVMQTVNGVVRLLSEVEQLADRVPFEAFIEKLRKEYPLDKFIIAE